MIQHATYVKRGGVWAGMGLGKTTGILTALDNMYIAGEMTRPTLVPAPLRVAKNTWPTEAEKWDHLRHTEVHAIVGEPKDRERALQKALAAGNCSIFTINYENLPWLAGYLDEKKIAWPFGTVVPDESTRLKSLRISLRTSSKGKEYLQGQGSIRAKALAKAAHKHADRFIELTGTPSPNGLQDLWGQAWFLDGGARLGRSFEAFKQRWFRPTPDGYGIEPLPHAQAEIQARMRDICLTLDARDYFDLREPIVRTIYVDLPPKARRIYDEMERKMFAEIGGHEVEAFNAAAKTMKCLQIANGAAYVEDDDGADSKAWVEVHDAKLQALESIVEEAAGMPVLVAYHFKSDLARILKAFPKARYLDDKKQTEDDWNAGKIPVMPAHPASAGHGLNLQDGGNILAVFGHWWDLEQYLQIIERIGPTRQMQAGHDRPMFIYHIVARDTMDEVVMERRDSKRTVQDLLLEAAKRRGSR
jgi:SNF2 family DNA or RNA helicase